MKSKIHHQAGFLVSESHPLAVEDWINERRHPPLGKRYVIDWYCSKIKSYMRKRRLLSGATNFDYMRDAVKIANRTLLNAWYD
jgi:hypothetical protein